MNIVLDSNILFSALLSGKEIYLLSHLDSLPQNL